MAVSFLTRLNQFARRSRHVVLYGAALAALAFLLKWLQVRYVVADLPFEVYVGLVAVLFTGLGVWVATQLARPRAGAAASADAVSIDEAEIVRLGFTTREYDVLKLLAQGRSNAEIGACLFLSVSTVKTHVSNVLAKLDVRSRAQAVVKAKTLHLVP
jgi:two-component system, NarL family, response regulator LiaR